MSLLCNVIKKLTSVNFQLCLAVLSRVFAAHSDWLNVLWHALCCLVLVLVYPSIYPSLPPHSPFLPLSLLFSFISTTWSLHSWVFDSHLFVSCPLHVPHLFACFISLLWSSQYPSSTTSSWPLDASPCPAVTEPQEIDLIYQVLKQAGEISSSRGGATRASTPAPPATATSSNQHNTTMLGSVSVKQSEPPNGTGSTATSAASFHRRSGPSQQQPLLLRGATSSLTVGPVPHASISGVFVPSMFQCSWCWLNACSCECWFTFLLCV